MKLHHIKMGLWMVIILAILVFIALWVQVLKTSDYGIVRQDSASMPIGWYLKMPLN